MFRRAESGELPNLFFPDEVSFKIEQFVSKQNDRVYLLERSFENLHHRMATRKQAALMVMVWVAANGRSPLIFLDRSVKINAIIYRETVVEAVLKPWGDKNFGRKPWTFQQDSVPSHKARVNQEWSKNNVPHFISSTELLALTS